MFCYTKKKEPHQFKRLSATDVSRIFELGERFLFYCDLSHFVTTASLVRMHYHGDKRYVEIEHNMNICQITKLIKSCLILH